MSKKLQKSLTDYLNKIKNPNPETQLASSNSFSSPKKWTLRGCKHPKTLSFAIDHSRHRPDDRRRHQHGGDSSKDDDAATLSDVDRFLFENFRSLYISNEGEQDQKRKDKLEDDDRVQSSNSLLFESPRFLDPPPNFSAGGGSHRRFFVAPGSSGSLMEEARASSTSAATEENVGSSSGSTTFNTLNDESIIASSNEDQVKHVRLPDDCIAVLAYSPSPYEDFRRSMQEMVQERLEHKGKIDWDFMEELLFCYLNLNEKKSHRFILSAFVDLIVRLRKTLSSSGSRSSAHPPPGSRRTRVSRERKRRILKMET
ncbi:hypothetical protein Tsubulata_043324 [Turnera subulata]|uniref:Transcription repressor n=1 Tax=Turnera subulata TaxID=218843 RepID=A0A9Q0FSB1_9ROSI|nr:hypothetical protein Tsubulata_043324 [Turnera subulata]